jgi:aryl-alcohol dehydrogenase-like predicted oxidoreductase
MASIPQKTLGSGAAALLTSAQGFGCMGITSFYGTRMKDEDAIELLQHVHANGVTHWDTAEVYTAQDADGSTVYNETVVGKAIKQIGRANIQIATKYMPKLHGKEMTADTVLAACRASCQRLGVDSVDLYYVHRIHPGVAVEEQAEAMKAVIDAGLSRCIGLSEFSPANLRRFHAICPVTVIQQEWSLMNRDLEGELLATARELGVGIVAYSPLSRSLLSGEVSSSKDMNGAEDLRASRYPRFAEENLERNANLVGQVRELAVERNVTPAQLSLAWVQNQGEDVIPIPGTTKIAHFNDNCRSQEVVLSKQELELIASVVPHDDQVFGMRFASGDQATFKGNMGASL